MVQEKRMIESFMKYVQIASPSKKEKEFADVIKKELELLGFEIYVDQAGEKVGSNTGNIIARWEGNSKKEPILFSCHLDTVPPGENIKPIRKEEKIISNGNTILGADDKAGIAALIEALKTVKEKNIEHGTIEVVLTICEEIGLFGIRNLAFDKLRSKKAYVLDSEGKTGKIVVQGPGENDLEIKVFGKAAHAGIAPEQGISAIQVAAHAISKMNLLRIDEETTANIGIIHGGEATNVVTPEIHIEAEARSQDEKKLERQTQHMIGCFEQAAQKFGAKVQIKKAREYSSFQIGKEEKIVQTVQKACETIGIKAYTQRSGGGSDTNIFNEYGIQAVNLATGEGNPHTKEEYIEIEDFINTAKMIVEIIRLA
ncbi:M20/M25/M40 family metallo-hydrolase [Garciella nitratireducens]|uniref:M20/M25/M40 family metallo-hydrolase n=1 Tax=Garciella nitratireducens TaxID=218205 RepID=UPI000DEAC1AF|nr:M20/M25/M40 family metallo-hydrolase [Garciella nitratireducens]RBP43992.1 tripeptide aminopeptidase [Garciella nitratireducens]